LRLRCASNPFVAAHTSTTTRISAPATMITHNQIGTRARYPGQKSAKPWC